MRNGRQGELHGPLRERPPLVVSFVRSHVASFAASALDFAVFWVLFHELHVFYVTASVFGAVHGAVVNFLLGRHWIFEATEESIFSQGWRYGLIAAGSVTWNGIGIYLMAGPMGWDETVSKLVTGFVVGVCWNFVLHRRFVFSPKRSRQSGRKTLPEPRPARSDD